MGTHRAGASGTIIFSYPAFTKRWELGMWIITAQRANGTMLQTRLRVISHQKRNRRVLSRNLLGEPWRNRVIWDEVTLGPNGGPFRQYLAVAAVP